MLLKSEGRVLMVPLKEQSICKFFSTINLPIFVMSGRGLDWLAYKINFFAPSP